MVYEGDENEIRFFYISIYNVDLCGYNKLENFAFMWDIDVTRVLMGGDVVSLSFCSSFNTASSLVAQRKAPKEKAPMTFHRLREFTLINVFALFS